MVHTTAMRRLPYTLDMRGKIPIGLELVPGELRVGELWKFQREKEKAKNHRKSLKVS